MRIAIIENGVVTNICEATQEWVSEHGGVDVDGIDGVSIGWKYDGVVFTPPPPIKLSYEQLRESAYPPLPDQLDMQFKDALNGTTTWVDAIAAVKAKYPKP